MLIAMAGLPGVGKSTIARELAGRLGATYLRIDTIETALKRLEGAEDEIGPQGYFAAYAIAEDNLKLGRSVVADSVNPLGITRDAWHKIARRVGVRCIDIEVVCTDTVEHRTRVETRKADIEGLRQPTWNEVQDRDYECWVSDRLVIDTAILTVGDAVKACLSRIDRTD